MEAALEINDISKTYSNGTRALNKIKSDLFYGEIVGLIGPNGAGKSTLIHIIAGVLKHDEGNLTCHIDDSKEIAWVSQFSCIDWYLSVIDNVRLGARLGGYSIKEAEEIASDCLVKVELQHKSHHQPDALSGGEQRRMQIARAMAQNSRILVLDEPTIGLDPTSSTILMKNLRKIANRNCLVIISSHDLYLIEKEVDRILFIKQGLLIADTKISHIKTTQSNLYEYYKHTMSS